MQPAVSKLTRARCYAQRSEELCVDDALLLLPPVPELCFLFVCCLFVVKLQRHTTSASSDGGHGRPTGTRAIERRAVCSSGVNSSALVCVYLPPDHFFLACFGTSWELVSSSFTQTSNNLFAYTLNDPHRRTQNTHTYRCTV